MKKMLITVLLVIVVMSVFPMTASADTDPKQSVVVDFAGLEGQNYLVTLLSESPAAGPNLAFGYLGEDEGEELTGIEKIFDDYEDPDGFYFLRFFEDCSETNRFEWGYYPPRTFKVLLYFPETGSFLCSDKSFERYAFDSYFTAHISDLNLAAEAQSAGIIVVKKSYPYATEILALIVRIIITLVIEIGIALLFGFRERKQLKLILITNIVTQISLNLLLNYVNYNSGPLMFKIFYFLLELAVFAAEAINYVVCLNKISKEEVPRGLAVKYALVANAASFFIGYGLSQYIPEFF